MSEWSELLNGTRIIPVLVIDQIEDAVPLARTLCDAGLFVLEITLRTAVARDAIKRIQADVAAAIVGVGTILEDTQLLDVSSLGVRFAVSPGHTLNLLETARLEGIAYLPGAQTLSEVLFLREKGFFFQKFFPAELSGGTKALKAISSVIPDVTFCPTGGLTPENASEYLSLKNVECIGGSWIAPRDLIRAHEWEEISKRAKSAILLNKAN